MVIGATNRPDAIDAALRRPGRFDRELLFPLPDAAGRRAIVDIHTGKWNPPLNESIKGWIVESTAGYCGADLKAFCAEASLVALRRTFPQVYTSDTRLDLNTDKLTLKKGDFAAALNKIVPSSKRSLTSLAKPLSPMYAPLLESALNDVTMRVDEVFPAAQQAQGKLISKMDGSQEDILTIRGDSEEWIASLTDANDASTLAMLLGDSADVGVASSSSHTADENRRRHAWGDNWMWGEESLSHKPRIMIYGPKGVGHAELGKAVLHHLEALPAYTLDLPSLIGDHHAMSPEQALVSRVHEAYRNTPSVVYMPDVSHWWRSSNDSMRATLCSLVESSPSDLSVLWLSTYVSDDSGSVSLTANNIDNFGPISSSTSHDNNDSGSDPALALMDCRFQALISWLSGDSEVIPGSMSIPARSASDSVVRIATPSEDVRLRFFHAYFDQIPSLPAKIYIARKQILTSRLQILTASSKNVGSQSTAELTDQDADKSTGLRKSSRRAAAEANSAIAAMSPTKQRPSAQSIEPRRQVPQNLPPLSDRDLQCMRELRTFFRAALSELLKEKRNHVFIRPVDPENVPDYYDIITSPMDLETMRMKVDGTLYVIHTKNIHECPHAA